MTVIPLSHLLIRPSPLPPPRRSTAVNLPRPALQRLRSTSRWGPLVLRCSSSSSEDNTNTSSSSNSSETPKKADKEKKEVSGETEKVAAELKELLAERKKREDQSPVTAGLFSGVAEEVGEIEWPPLGKVLGTTGVVLAVIAGSSIALLTVNAVLAELSDRVFAGKGVQDFF